MVGQTSLSWRPLILFIRIYSAPTGLGCDGDELVLQPATSGTGMSRILRSYNVVDKSILVGRKTKQSAKG